MTRRRLLLSLNAAILLLISACGALTRCSAPAPLDDAAMAALYDRPLPPPEAPQRVFHLGHSLVGRDMPAMLQQLAGAGHEHASQLGWGTSLREHWEPDLPIAGFEEENDHPRHRDAAQALDSGAFDALVLTEMVELRDAIRYHASADYLHRWVRRARAGNPDIRVYLYETWHHLDDPDGWLERIDGDLSGLWEGDILRRALAQPQMDAPVYLIPAGQVLAAFVRAVQARGGVDGIAGPEDLFARTPLGVQDTIHLNDKGAYLVALTHYAVLYQQDPQGLPHRLRRADGTPAEAPGTEAARLMQQTVWQVVTALPLTGLPQR
jgi:hypothetical protein